MSTLANSKTNSIGAPYMLSNPIAASSPRTVPIIIAVAVHVVLILGLAKGLSAVRLPTLQTITEAFSVPAETKPQEPVPEIKPVETVDMAPLETLTPPPPVVVESEVAPTEPTEAISVTAQPPATDTPLAEVKLLRQVEPQYPAMSKRMDEQGTVVMRATIQPNGRVASVDIVTSSGYARLDQAARDAVRQWTFARRDGASVAYSVTVPVKFKLDDAR